MYNFYFVFEGEEIRLPVPPSSLTTKIANKNKTIELLNLGEVNILTDPGLSSISLKILLPSQQYPFAIYPYGFKPPQYFLNKFKTYKLSKKPVLFKVTRITSLGELMYDTNMSVSLENYTIEENAKEGNDVLVDIELKEYKEYETKPYTLVKQELETNKVYASVEAQRTTKEPVSTYTVKMGDTLWSICKKQLNDGNLYKEVAKLNNITNPNKIYAGQVLKLVEPSTKVNANKSKVKATKKSTVKKFYPSWRDQIV